MKALSIKQPWAYLVASGHKKYETRSWATKYRGPVMIHSSAGLMTKLQKRTYERWIRDYGLNVDYQNYLYYGCIIGVATLADVCVINEQFTIDKLDGAYLSNKEYTFGDYSLPGRFAWEMKDAMMFDRSIPMKGNLGIWNYTPNSEQTLLSMYEAYKALKNIPG